MSFITSGAWARPVQDASTALVEGGVGSPRRLTFENDIAEDIFITTLNRATSSVRDFFIFDVTVDSDVEAEVNIQDAFWTASCINYCGYDRLDEDEATVALMALNLASNGDFYISAEEAKIAEDVILNVRILMSQDCSWNKMNYCEPSKLSGLSDNWRRLYSNAKGILYDSNQKCDQMAGQALGFLLSFYDYISKERLEILSHPNRYCNYGEKYDDELLEQASKYLDSASVGLTEFYPEYWK